MFRSLAAALALLLALGANAAARELTEREAKLELVLDDPGAVPREREMILATIRGTYDILISLEELSLPRMPDFEWVQLLRPEWTSQRIGGRQVRVMEVRIAFFPRRPGTLTIAPIRHILTVPQPDGGRRTHEVVSPPVTVEVAPSLAARGEWWLPAKMIEMSDKWDKPPGDLAPNETAVRRVTLWVLGATAQMLPPPPAMREPWLITFAAPETRTTELTWGGPISTVTWEWTFQPKTGEPGVLPRVDIPFFDTLERQTHTVELPATPIAVRGFGENAAEAWREDFEGTPILLLAGLAGFLATLLALYPGLRLSTGAETSRWLRRIVPDRHARALRRAVRSRDHAAARKAALALLDRRGLVDAGRREELLEPANRRLFARPTHAPRPADDRRELAALAARVAEECRELRV